MADTTTPNTDPTGGTSVLGEDAPTGVSAAAPAEGPADSAFTEDNADDEAPAPSGFARIKSDAAGFRDQAADQARAYATTGKDRATDLLDGYAETVHDAAARIEELAGPQVAQYARSAAELLEEFAENLRTKNVDELVEDARVLVRRSPAIAIGAAATIGFALSRFLKSTSDRLEPEYGPAASRKANGAAQPAYDA